MNLWDWVSDTLLNFKRAAERGDADRGQLVRVYEEALMEPLTLLQRDPASAFSRLSEGRAIAERLGESGWVLLLDHWRTRALRADHQPRRALDIAMHATLYARKAPFNQYPQRFCLHLEDVVGPFIMIDPQGHAESIRAAFDYIEAELAPGLECAWCLMKHRASFASSCQREDEAEAYALQALARCEGKGSLEAQVYHQLCDIAADRQDWPAVQVWAMEGEQAARRSQRVAYLAAFLAWQAAAARRTADEGRARQFYRAASAQAEVVGGITPGWGPYALPVCHYYEAGDELHRALAIRERQIELVTNQGLTYSECYYRLEQCRLLAQLGRSIEQAAASLRTTAADLSQPSRFLEPLADLEG